MSGKAEPTTTTVAFSHSTKNAGMGRPVRPTPARPAATASPAGPSALIRAARFLRLRIPAWIGTVGASSPAVRPSLAPASKRRRLRHEARDELAAAGVSLAGSVLTTVVIWALVRWLG